jgi:ABC-type Co2+ transport system permease subunit
MQKQLADIYSILTGANTQAMSEIGIVGFVVLMLISLASSLLAAFLYLHFYANRATGSQVHRAFPLLGLSITAIFVAIQFSLPLSLGLLGALSIVRFRTPIKEPEEIGFIMLVIAASLSAATFKLAFVGLIFVVAILALLVQSRTRAFSGSQTDGVIVISMPRPGASDESAIADLLRRHLSKARLESVSRNEHGTVLSYNFQDASERSLFALKGDLAAAADGASFNIYFNRAGAL